MWQKFAYKAKINLFKQMQSFPNRFVFMFQFFIMPFTTGRR